MSSLIRAYTLNTDQKTDWLDYVSESDAHRMIDDRFSKLENPPEDADEQLALGMFGFAKDSDKNFIEVSIIHDELTFFKHERTTPRKLLMLDASSTTTWDEKLKSKSEVKEWVSLYFNRSDDQFVRKLRDAKAKKSSGLDWQIWLALFAIGYAIYFFFLK